MVLLLPIDVLQHGIKLARTDGKRTITALPEKTAIASINRFDPFGRRFLDLLDELSLGKSSGQRGDNVNVINDTASAYEFATEVTADCGEICVNAWPHF
jgi:hypothetical protein